MLNLLAPLLDCFPAQSDALKELYRLDPGFAEICDDFLELSEMSSPDVVVESYLEESLKGLKQEISEYLLATTQSGRGSALTTENADLNSKQETK